VSRNTEELSISINQSSESADVSLAGELDVASAPSLRTCLSQCMEQGCANITLEMSGVSFMDSNGIVALLAIKSQLEELGGTLTVSRPSWTVRKVLDVTALTSEFGIASGE
jgi:anti-anti-sigma factor